MAEWERALPRLKEAFEAWGASKGQSIETWLGLMAERVDWRSLADGQHGIPWTRQGKSREDVRDYLEGLTAAFEMDHYTVERFICQDDSIVAIGQTAWWNLATGNYFETPIVTVWRFRDGEVVSFLEYYDTATIVASGIPRA